MSLHMPVMLNEVLDALAVQDGDVVVDGTFGAGGYTRALLAEAECRVIGLDRDPAARTLAKAVRRLHPGRFVFAQARFSALDDAVKMAGGAEVDGVVLDVGVSSMQLDQAERGFSFRADGPLDMRMSSDGGVTAADILSELAQADLEQVLRVYGEERHARRVATAIVKARAAGAIERTAQLAEIVQSALGPGDGRIHPATRTFQALRILINDELGELAQALVAAERILRPGGRLVVVSFHSLEDRIVKGFLRRRAGLQAQGSRHLPPTAAGPEPSFKLAFTGARGPSDGELTDNPRARSAKLRAATRTDAPAWDEDSEAETPHVAAQAMVSGGREAVDLAEEDAP